jgi:GAF domain
LASRLHPEVLCVVGIPPRAVRHIRMKCHQIRARFPEAVVLACALSDENDLSSLRSRVPAEDAQHVVYSLQLMRDYLISLLHPAALPQEPVPETEGATETARELKEESQELRQADAFDGPVEGMFNRLAVHLARSFDAPIAMITAVGGQKHFWEAQCGLPDDTQSSAGLERDRSICGATALADSIVVIADIAVEGQFTADPFIKDHGIRFYAGSPLKAHDGTVIGSVCVLDTRPRQITEKQKETLTSVAESVVMAIELSEPMHIDTVTDTEQVSPN